MERYQEERSGGTMKEVKLVYLPLNLRNLSGGPSVSKVPTVPDCATHAALSKAKLFPAFWELTFFWRRDH